MRVGAFSQGATVELKYRKVYFAGQEARNMCVEDGGGRGHERERARRELSREDAYGFRNCFYDSGIIEFA